MEKQIIKVSNTDERFDAIIELYQKNYIHDSFVVNIVDNKIISNDCIFEKTVNEVGGIEDSLTITSEGAQWFNMTSKNKNNDSMWQRNMDQVAENFHKEHSFLICTIDAQEIDKTEVLKTLNFISPIEYSDKDVVQISSDKLQYEDIFGVNMRLLITDGTGEEKPIIAKIFLSGKLGQFQPIQTIDSLKILKSVEETLKKREKEEIVLKDSRDTSTSIQNFLSEQLFSSDFGFQDFLVLDGQDENIIKDLVERNAADEVKFEATDIKVLSIFTVKFPIVSFSIFKNDIETYTLNVGSNNSISIICNSCRNNELIVDSNKIRVMVNEQYKSYFIDELDDNTMDKLKKNPSYPFYQHNIEKKCSVNKPCLKVCEKFVCMSELNQELNLCMNCEHLEIMQEYNGVQYKTEDMKYCNHKNKLVPKDLVLYCRSCEQTYSADILIKRKCLSCYQLDHGKCDNKIYENFSALLPVSLRLTTSNKRKLCVHNDNFIIFKMKNSKYIFEKQNIYLGNTIKKPKVIKEG